MQVTGVVKNKNTNETIVGAVVFVSDVLGKVKGAGTSSNIDGKYTLSANDGDYITAQIIGMKPLTQKVSGNTLDFSLQDSSTSTLGTFEVVAPKPEPKPKETPKPKPIVDKKILLIAGAGIMIAILLAITIKKLAKK